MAAPCFLRQGGYKKESLREVRRGGTHCDPSTGEAEAKGPGVWGQSGLHRKGDRDRIKHCLPHTNQNKASLEQSEQTLLPPGEASFSRAMSKAKAKPKSQASRDRGGLPSSFGA